MNILITGGAGYIGSHVVLEALDNGHSVTVFDDLSTGNSNNINKKTIFFKGSTLFKHDLKRVMENSNFDAVIHLAASKAAGESMEKPDEYAENNILGGINLINACIEYNIKVFVFSSTAAVYGEPKYVPIDENHNLDPSNFYGFTKLIIEENLEWFCKLKNLHFASLRYFNAAGYDVKKRISCLESNPQNLIPKVMETIYGSRKKINIYGNDYSTRDGTGVRDYVHVNDLAKAHLNSIDYVLKNKTSVVLNLGAEIGCTVLEVIKKVEELSGQKVNYDFCDRRYGDPETMISNASYAKKLIGWNPNFSDLNTIIKTTIRMYESSKFYS